MATEMTAFKINRVAASEARRLGAAASKSKDAA
jgi:hypothetical protein